MWLTTEEALRLVAAERKRQIGKGGRYEGRPPCEWATIIIKELGEFASASLASDWARAPSFAMLEGMVRVAAVAVAAVECVAGWWSVDIDELMTACGYAQGENWDSGIATLDDAQHRCF